MTVKTHAWTPAMFKAFRLICKDQGLTFRQIQDKMNLAFGLHLTRNACIGKAHRLGLPPRVITNNPANRSKAVVKKPFVFTPIQPILPPRPREPFTLLLEQLRSGDCKWPGHSVHDNTRAPFFFCGCRALSGRPYCAEHTADAHTASRPRMHP